MKNKSLKLIVAIIIFVLIIGGGAMLFGNTNESKLTQGIEPSFSADAIIPNYTDSRFKEIYLAGGCFWGVQAYFDQIIGVEYSAVGYANGDSDDTNYQVIGSTGHVETLYLVYDPESVALGDIITYFFSIIDPISLDKQGNDIGSQYRSGIYYVDSDDKSIIEDVAAAEQTKYSEPIVTEIEPLENFILAEEYHQKYLVNNPSGYCHVILEYAPNKKPVINASDYPPPDEDDISANLTDQQYDITQNNATEASYGNEYWDNEEPGLYVDIVTGEPLFTSLNKYQSQCGWPSFTRPIDWDVLIYEVDETLGITRIEVRSRSGDSHLGHVFNDGPAAEGGLRYCINSGALSFIHLDDLTEAGYGEFSVLFEY